MRRKRTIIDIHTITHIYTHGWNQQYFIGWGVGGAREKEQRFYGGSGAAPPIFFFYIYIF